jgi:hypothetical protein
MVDDLILSPNSGKNEGFYHGRKKSRFIKENFMSDKKEQSFSTFVFVFVLITTGRVVTCVPALVM